ncbi:MAG: thioredoxin family protein [Betaproteobacteria bacterium]|jgi:thioredoxin|nr:thioredoxin family protein [Betaproteobacteria bacterium]MBT6412331.1 thioredoxin family protein [Betaproteobacteria bacterium]MCH1424470.1 thioredoxin family protein [Burkholderiales bacterium]MDA9194556.1 thioredoxin family protein [Burkholderiales bacterium]MDA9994559.1 thioredoxin family protein [Burkholderiales bacterium]
MPVANLTSKTFDQAVKENDMVIIDFWAPWCAPCKTFAPVFEAASETYTGVYFAKVNSEEEQELAESFGIRSIPTLVVIREQIILYSKPGAVPAYSLEGLLDRMAKLDMTQVRDEIANSKTEAKS